MISCMLVLRYGRVVGFMPRSPPRPAEAQDRHAAVACETQSLTLPTHPRHAPLPPYLNYTSSPLFFKSLAHKGRHVLLSVFQVFQVSSQNFSRIVTSKGLI